jgi:hypothetical protein
MPGADREQWIAIFESAASSSPDEMDDQWEWLLDELGIRYDHFEALTETLKQGRWRDAKNPKAYVKTVTRREAIRLGLVEAPDKSMVLVTPRNSSDPRPASQGDVLDEYTLTSERATRKGADGIWRGGSGLGDYHDDPEWKEDFDTAWDYLLSKLPDDLKETRKDSTEITDFYTRLNERLPDTYFHMPSPVRPKWSVLAERAGFNEWEVLVLRCRLSRISREKAIAGQPDEKSRKALQAAWRQFDRTGMGRLTEFIKKKR